MLSEQDWAKYEREGYLRLGQVATDEELCALQKRMDEIMLGQVRYDKMFFQLDSATGVYGDVPGGGGWGGPTLNYRKIETLERDEHFLRYIQHPLFRDITRRVHGENIAVFRAMFMNKPAHRGTILPYHQDGGDQWGLDRPPLITIWTALDDATVENGCVQIIPGSHRLGLLSQQGHTITPEQEEQYCQDKDSVFLDAKAGEAILLHNWLLHRSGINTIERPRRAFSACYMEAATRSTKNPDRRFPIAFGEGALRAGVDTQPDYVETAAA